MIVGDVADPKSPPEVHSNNIKPIGLPADHTPQQWGNGVTR